MGRQNLELSTNLIISLSQQEELKLKWNQVISSSEAFLPHERRHKVGVKEAIEENKQLGAAAVGFLKLILKQLGREKRAERARSEKKVVAVGYGRGYDSNWLYEAAIAGFKTWWIDVSDVACGMAWEDLISQVSAIEAKKAKVECPLPSVREGEIYTVLMNPESINLDLDSVSIWYLCRTLGCLYEESVPFVLQTMGHSLAKEVDPSGENQIVIVNALREDNPNYESRTSVLYSKAMIQKNIAKGAGRSVEIWLQARHNYYDKIVTAMAFRAKK